MVNSLRAEFLFVTGSWFKMKWYIECADPSKPKTPR